MSFLTMGRIVMLLGFVLMLVGIARVMRNRVRDDD
jgi:hypothetical protein